MSDQMIQAAPKGASQSDLQTVRVIFRVIGAGFLFASYFPDSWLWIGALFLIGLVLELLSFGFGASDAR